jgi:hypothetical protein
MSKNWNNFSWDDWSGLTWDDWGGLTFGASGGVLGDHEINMTWPAYPGAKIYEIYRSGALISGTSDITFTDIVFAGVTYSYQIKALDDAGVVIAESVPRAGRVGTVLKFSSLT